MRAVNLLPREDTRRSEAFKPASAAVMIAALGGGIVILALAIAFVVTSRDVNTQRATLASAQAQLAATPATPSRVSQARAKLISDRDRRAVALASALSQRVSWDRVLRRLALVLPGDIWLTNLAGTTPLTTADTAAAASAASAASSSGVQATATGLTLQGYAYSQDAVARLLSRLQVVPDLKNVQLQTSKTAELAGRKIVQFTILSDIRHGSDGA
jgi:Tfp pilus assembly protein PilN